MYFTVAADGSVLETTGPDSVRAEIVLKMGAMSMEFTGTVEVAEP